MRYILIRKLCLLAATATAVALATGCGHGGKISNCAALQDRQWRSLPHQFHFEGELVKLAQLPVTPPQGPQRSGC
jgi:hypothetical protein